jgi:hypothetical protein
VIGKYHKRVIAYYRRYNDQHLIVILPLSTATLEGDSLWEDTQIRLPETAPSALVNLLTAEVIDAGKILHLEEVFDVVPFAILRNSKATETAIEKMLLLVRLFPWNGRFLLSCNQYKIAVRFNQINGMKQHVFGFSNDIKKQHRISGIHLTCLNAFNLGHFHPLQVFTTI